MQKENLNELELFQNLVNRDEIASSQLFDWYYDDLFQYFQSAFKGRISEDELRDVIADSFFKFIGQPEKFKPAKGSLRKYLEGDVRGDIKNFLEKKSINLVELDDEFRNSIGRVDSPEILFLNNETISQVERKLSELFETEQDQKIAWNVVCHIRDTEVYSEVLGIHNLPEAEQKKEVKRHKDRIKKQLERNGWKDFLKQLRDA